MENWPDHYRYVDEVGPDGVTIFCRRYVVVRESEHCYWLASTAYAPIAKMAIEKGRIPKYLKRVLKSSIRSFAYPDKAQALHSYKRRKKSQLFRANWDLERAKAALNELEGKDSISDKHNCAGGDYFKEFGGWDYC